MLCQMCLHRMHLTRNHILWRILQHSKHTNIYKAYCKMRKYFNRNIPKLFIFPEQSRFKAISKKENVSLFLNFQRGITNVSFKVSEMYCPSVNDRFILIQYIFWVWKLSNVMSKFRDSEDSYTHFRTQTSRCKSLPWQMDAETIERGFSFISTKSVRTK